MAGRCRGASAVLPQSPGEAFAERAVYARWGVDAQGGRQVADVQVGQGLGEFGERVRGGPAATEARGDGGDPDQGGLPPPHAHHQIPRAPGAQARRRAEPHASGVQFGAGSVGGEEP